MCCISAFAELFDLKINFILTFQHLTIMCHELAPNSDAPANCSKYPILILSGVQIWVSKFSLYLKGCSFFLRTFTMRFKYSGGRSLWHVDISK